VISGRIKWFNAFQGHGYIVLSDGTEVYFHGAVLRRSGLVDHLLPGSTVSFDLIHTRGGLEATNVDLVG
jgi:cold shock CspA family protein